MSPYCLVSWWNVIVSRLDICIYPKTALLSLSKQLLYFYAEVHTHNEAAGSNSTSENKH